MSQHGVWAGLGGGANGAHTQRDAALAAPARPLSGCRTNIQYIKRSASRW